MTSPSTFKLGQHRPKDSRRVPLLILSSIILLVVAGAVYWFVIRDTAPLVDQNANDPTNESAKTALNQSKTQGSVTDTPTTTSEEVPVSNTASVTITNASQSGSLVNAKATISGTPDQGTCVFLFSAPEAKPVTKEATSSGGSEQSCSVSVSEVEFDLLGQWGLTVTFFRDNTKASANTELTIQ